MMIPAYPLQWPAFRTRTRIPEPTTYSITLHVAYEHAVKQLTLLGASKIVVSSNAILRKDGTLSVKQPKTLDTGVAAWFQLAGFQSTWYCISSDSYNSVAGNLRAIGLSVVEIRNITRRLNTPLIRMFTATPPEEEKRQEPPPRQDQRREPPPSWRIILSVSVNAGWHETKRAYYRLAKSYHPDTGGNVAQFQELSKAYLEAKRHFGVL